MVSFESMANSTKFRNCYIAVKSNGTPGSTRATGFLSDDILFQVRIAQLVSVLLELLVVTLFTHVQPRFYNGAKVILFSKEFKKAIRLMPNGDVNCLGGHGMKGDHMIQS